MPIEVAIFIENIINGLTLGAFYALMTLGLALIFGVARLVNFAQGDIFMVGGYALFLLLTFSGLALPYPVIVVLVVIITALVGLLLERVVIHPHSQPKLARAGGGDARTKHRPAKPGAHPVHQRPQADAHALHAANSGSP